MMYNKDTKIIIIMTKIIIVVWLQHENFSCSLSLTSWLRLLRKLGVNYLPFVMTRQCGFDHKPYSRNEKCDIRTRGKE